MGRKAKLKKIKKQTELNQEKIKNTDIDNQEFVKEIEHKGYNFKQIRRSPEIPSNKIEPQI